MEAKKNIALFVAVWLLFLAMTTLVVSRGYRIGLDVQWLSGEPSCLDESVFVMRMRVDRPPEIGDYVVAKMPDSRMSVGAPAGARLIKKVVARAGDKIRIKDNNLYINGVFSDRLWLAKSIPGKTSEDFEAEYELAAHQYFLMGTTKESFDSRYWGVVNLEAIRGYAYPVL